MILETIPADRYDVVVIGSGPAGISLALRIAEQSAARVALVESGSLVHDEKVQQLSDVTGGGDLGAGHFAFHSQRVFGGTSSIWGGWCAALERRAFELGEWPIAYEEVDRYYPDAASVLGASPNVYLYREATIENCPGLVYKPFYLTDPLRFGSKFESTIAEHIQVDLLLNRTCARLEKDGETITAAVLQDSTNADAEPVLLEADYFVVACGGIGNPRVLQNSGVATASPVGRHLMEHPHIHAVSKIYLDEDRIRQHAVTEDSVVHALQLSTQHCIEQDALSFSVAFELGSGQSKPLLGQNRNLVLSSVTIRAEMLPDPLNAVSPGDELDALGQPKSHIDFLYNYHEAAYRSWQLFGTQLLQSGLGRPATLNPDFIIGGGGHFIGTTRMGTAESDSVVDSDCKVHSTANLYVAGSSVFPAGGVANPTFTIVAMSLRLGDHLAGLIGET